MQNNRFLSIKGQPKEKKKKSISRSYSQFQQKIYKQNKFHQGSYEKKLKKMEEKRSDEMEVAAETT